LKEPKIIIILTVFVLALSLYLFNNESLSHDDLVDSGIDYNEIIDQINNPERGFYRTIPLRLTPTGVNPIPEWQLRSHLLHLRLNISDFNDGSPFTEAMLNDLNRNMEQIRQSGAMTIVRFAYDFDGNINTEPDIEDIVAHIHQLTDFFHQNEDIITVVESGLIGPWGEQHGSAIVMPENLNRIIEALLIAVPDTRTINVRRPLFFANFVGVNINEIDSFVSLRGTDAYRIGIFNDGYLGSHTDLGTYVDRARELRWLRNQAAHTLFGGEVVTSHPASQGIFNTVEHISYEMYYTHTSYLNYEWNQAVINMWRDDIYRGPDQLYYGLSGLTYIENRLGYRFVIRDSRLSRAVSKGNNLTMQFQIENVGAGNVINARNTSLIFVKDGEVKHTQNLNIDVRGWRARTYHLNQNLNDVTLNVLVPNHLATGEYRVYLRIAMPNDNDIRRMIRFANADVWHSELGANFMGSFEVLEEVVTTTPVQTTTTRPISTTTRPNTTTQRPPQTTTRVTTTASNTTTRPNDINNEITTTRPIVSESTTTTRSSIMIPEEDNNSNSRRLLFIIILITITSGLILIYRKRTKML